MTIKAVFRVQCDGMCKGWLSLPDAHRLGTDIRHVELVVRPTAANAGLWPGERTARRAALGNGWEVSRGRRAPWTMRCPECRLNPLGIRLPPPGIERFEDTRSDDPSDWMPGDRGWTG